MQAVVWTRAALSAACTSRQICIGGSCLPTVSGTGNSIGWSFMHDVMWPHRLFMTVLAVPIAVVSGSFLRSHDHHMQPPSGFLIDFIFWKPAVSSDYVTMGCCSIAIVSPLPSTWILINDHEDIVMATTKRGCKSPFFQSCHKFRSSLNKWMLSEDYLYQITPLGTKLV